MLLEKAYAKWYGSFTAIEGGFVQNALCDFVPGSVGESIQMTDDGVKADIRSGALWEKLKQFVRLGYLLGAGSPSECSARSGFRDVACGALLLLAWPTRLHCHCR